MTVNFIERGSLRETFPAEGPLVAFSRMVAASRRFYARIALVFAGALSWRVYYVLGPVQHHFPKLGFNDELFYNVQAQLFASGRWFDNPFWTFATPPRYVPTALHPPLFTMFLAIPAKLGFTTQIDDRLATAVLGSITVVLIGLLARRIAGDGPGLVAAVIAAAYPPLWSNDSVIGLETLYCFLVILSLLAFYRFWRTPSLWWAAAIAACLSLAALTRSEGIILLVLLCVPAALWAPRWDWGNKLKALGIMALVAVVLISPWVIRNLVTFQEPTFLGTGFGGVLAYGNCDATYYGPKLGYWDDSCSLKNYPRELEESKIDKLARDKGVHYIKAHLGRVPVVLAARAGRVWDVFRPTQNREFNELFEQRGRLASWATLISYYVLLPFSITGLVIMRKRRIPIFPMIAIAVSVTLTAVLGYPITRYRAAFDSVMPVLTAVTLAALWHWWRHRGAPPAEVTPAEVPAPEPTPVGVAE
jgi:4-amino-4-deoxy-L-arabinose transferase-like glycosyltransferase